MNDVMSLGVHRVWKDIAAVRLNPQPGERLGPYEIGEKLGEGGMGQVFRAIDTRLNRPVAIKFLSPGVADDTGRRRFQQEARTASSLNHPHILTVYEAGQSEGSLYLITEFVDGGTLRDWVSSEKRQWQQVVEQLIGVADGLACATPICLPLSRSNLV